MFKNQLDRISKISLKDYWDYCVYEGCIFLRFGYMKWLVSHFRDYSKKAFNEKDLKYLEKQFKNKYFE